MNVFVQGVGDVALNNSNFIFQGGEGSIYAKGDSAYKIYTDLTKMIPSAKIQELQAIDDDKVIRPQHILLDKKTSPIGYSMRYLKDTSSLCQLFTKAFRDRNKIDNDSILHLVRGMQDTIDHIHSKKILIVDLNEMNFLVNKGFSEVYFIDVDSYQTKNFPATALMESVRDRHAKSFNEGTDWFSFAVVSFQLFIGIHPYKGKHPTYSDMDSRMMNNVSVLNKDVAIPRICQPFDVIPEVYRRWYAAVLERGDRLAPPRDLQAHANIVQLIKKVFQSDQFDIKTIYASQDNQDVIDYVSHNGCTVVTTASSVYVNNGHSGNSDRMEVGFTPKMNHAIKCYMPQDFILFYNLTLRKEVVGGMIAASSMMSYDGRVYALSGSNVLEIVFTEMGNDNVIVGSKVVASVLERATAMFKGVVIQNLLGAYYASVFPKAGASYQMKLPELNVYKIVDAKFDGRVLIVVASDKGKYDKFIYRFDKNYQTYSVRVVKDITILDINFVMLDNGVIASINDKENLELFAVAGGDIKEIESDAISSEMHLYKNGTQVLFSRGNEVCTLKMKGN